MGFTVDANLLVYAVNRDSSFHRKAKAFIESCAVSDETWYMCWQVIHAFLRISTHPKVLAAPLHPGEAVAVIDQILQLPHTQTIGPDGPQFWDIYKKEITAEHLRGNQITDAIICATMKAHGVRTIFTKDRDFLRFRGIKAVDPLT
ncbi:MAG: PIN domain-containing protein [Chitinispirillaceae bacterium]|nr:PIN domain-containing protein [Chitinispirillaceae bacterium]